VMLNEVDEAIAAREFLDLELVESDPGMRAEHALHTAELARLRGESGEFQRLLREAVEVVRASPEQEHQEMLRAAMGGLGFVVSGAASGVRERAIHHLGNEPEWVASEQVFAAMTRMQAGDTSVALETELADLGQALNERGLGEQAVLALYTATCVAAGRQDAQATAARAHQARQVLLTQSRPVRPPVRVMLDIQYANAMLAVGRREVGRQVLGDLIHDPALMQADLSAGLAHMSSAALALDDDPWGALSAAVEAHARLVSFRDSLPAPGERHGVDDMLGGAAEMAVRAAERIGNASIMAEVIDHLRAQGLPGAAGPESSGSTIPVWALLDALGAPATRPAWATEHEQEPTLLTGARPRVRMPWGVGEVSPLLAAHRDGQIVDIRVPR